ncbi:hypothetical protein M434DRAFT_36762 [Hypoxylon sp. CO27-5]|nr:hypothetical protein M434DRAFT_36762 [Hypoxylon sp. CO27-5]
MQLARLPSRLSVFRAPNILTRRACKARQRLVAASNGYFGNDKHLDGGSLFVQLTNKVNDSTGFSLVDKAQIEVGQVAAATFNAAPSAYCTKHPAAAFRGFGGGHVLCPERHLASTEMPVLIALILERVVVVPLVGMASGTDWSVSRQSIASAKAAGKWRELFTDKDNSGSIFIRFTGPESKT